MLFNIDLLLLVRIFKFHGCLKHEKSISNCNGKVFVIIKKEELLKQNKFTWQRDFY